jgi:glucuronoarabinoxylan endo-1,4-beta-xylanase
MMKKFITNLLIKKSDQIFILIFCLIPLLQADAQNVTVSGRLTASKFAVKNASVIFIDNSDTTNKFSALTDDSGNYQINLGITSVNTDNILPKKFELEQNYPNPFSAFTDIPYDLNEGCDIKVTIYDILGRVVRKFDVGQQSVGSHNVTWNGFNDFGQKVASGIYFYRLEASGESQVKKMVFNQDGKGIFVVPHSYAPKEKTYSAAGKINSILGNTFTLRIQNTNSTLPRVVSEDIENVVLQKDTTINLSVSYIPVTAINLDSLHQVIRGYGAANILPWRPDMTDSEIQTAFGTGNNHLGFTILRLRVPPDSNQWSANLATTKKAYDMGVKIIATPWSPPASMKTNNSLVSGELKESSYSDYADFLNAFVNYMSRNGVPLYAISIQNEPDVSVTYESCDWNASQFLNFCKNNAQSIGARIIMPESFHFDHSLSNPTLNDSVAASHVSIIGGHIYGGGISPYPLAKSKGKEVWMTEYLINSSGNGSNMDTSWAAALLTAQSINNCMNADMNAYVWWYIVRFYGPIDDGTYKSADKGNITKKGFVMSQFARFIRPGYVRVESSVYPPTNDISFTAYKDSLSSKTVIVAINSGSDDAETIFEIQGGKMTTEFTPYTTSASKNCEQGNAFNVSGENFTYTLEPSSITTFVSN